MHLTKGLAFPVTSGLHPENGPYNIFSVYNVMYINNMYRLSKSMRELLHFCDNTLCGVRHAYDGRHDPQFNDAVQRHIYVNQHYQRGQVQKLMPLQTSNSTSVCLAVYKFEHTCTRYVYACTYMYVNVHEFESVKCFICSFMHIYDAHCNAIDKSNLSLCSAVGTRPS